MAHAYVFAGDREEGITHALSHAEELLGASAQAHPDVLVLRYSLFSVADARRIIGFADQAPLKGEKKIVVMAASRFFHEAQNALLKVFEEPPAGTTLILVVPTEGILLPTLRSRLAPLPSNGNSAGEGEAFARTFLVLDQKNREKFITRLVDRSKSDKDEEKQAARTEAVQIIEGLTRIAHENWRKTPKKEYELLLKDLARFAPIMHERSAPLKLIFEHLLLTMPSSL